MNECTCIYKEIQLKSNSQNSGTLLAAACWSRRLCYRPAVFFCYFPPHHNFTSTTKKFVRISNMLLFHSLPFQNCLSVKLRKSGSVSTCTRLKPRGHRAARCLLLYYIQMREMASVSYISLHVQDRHGV